VASRGSVVHGAGIRGALDRPEIAGEKSLGAAFALMGRTVSLPDTSVVGPIRKIVVDDMTNSRKDYGLLVAYSSGVELAVEPGRYDWKAELLQAQDATFTDGGAHYEVRTTAGRDTWIVRGGTQVLPSGEYGLQSSIAWNGPGVVYSLHATSASTTVDDLLRIAATVR
jgi:hypothetical protein